MKSIVFLFIYCSLIFLSCSCNGNRKSTNDCNEKKIQNEMMNLPRTPFMSAEKYPLSVSNGEVNFTTGGVFESETKDKCAYMKMAIYTVFYYYKKVLKNYPCIHKFNFVDPITLKRGEAGGEFKASFTLSHDSIRFSCSQGQHYSASVANIPDIP